MSKTMFARTGTSTLAAVAAFCLAAPASAAPVEPAVPPSQSDSAPTAYKRLNQKICVVDAFTGSNIKRKVCKTRGDWIAQQGIDPLAVR